MLQNDSACVCVPRALRAQLLWKSTVLQKRGSILLEWFIWTGAYSYPRSERPQGRCQWRQPAGWGAPVVSEANPKKTLSPWAVIPMARGWGFTMGRTGAGGRGWVTFSEVNYMVDADELGRELKIYKEFVMGIYLHTYTAIDQNGSQQMLRPYWSAWIY